MAGYPRVIGYYPGTGIHGTYMGPPYYGHPMNGYLAGADAPLLPGAAPHLMPVHGGGPPAVVSPPWRPMMAPGSPPLGEGHVPIPLNPETFGGVWGNTTGGGAPAGTVITFSARPQKPFKASRLLIRGSASGASAAGTSLVGQVYIGTDLQQGEVGNIDLESLGAATAFDTWISFKQAEPGVWIRVLASVTIQPTTTDFKQYTVTAIGHYLH
jgi:hypothetical protein